MQNFCVWWSLLIGCLRLHHSFSFKASIKRRANLLTGMASPQTDVCIDPHLSQQEHVFPSWFETIKQHGTLVDIPEWNSQFPREENGFRGTDFCHGRNSPVRIVEYQLLPPSTEQAHLLVGLVHFTPAAESHRGLCHGGSMCALMDDAIGWMGFCCDGIVRPWSGFTVQVNTALKKAVPVGSLLKLEARVLRKEGTRKVWVAAKLEDHESKVVYAEGEGLFLRSLDSV